MTNETIELTELSQKIKINEEALNLHHTDMKFKFIAIWIGAACCFGQAVTLFADVALLTESMRGTLPIKSWKDLRDDRVVKQGYDFSCGAASLATVLHFYNKNVTEMEIMLAMNKTDTIVSFEDMANVLPKFGFKATGIALSYEQLTRLKIPVVAYLNPERDNHFTVIRGVTNSHVWIGDPSWGNRTLAKARFIEMWQTRDDPLYKGKVLVVQPIDSTPLSAGAFGKPRPNILPESLVTQRGL